METGINKGSVYDWFRDTYLSLENGDNSPILTSNLAMQQCQCNICCILGGGGFRGCSRCYIGLLGAREHAPFPGDPALGGGAWSLLPVASGRSQSANQLQNVTFHGSPKVCDASRVLVLAA